MKYLLLFSQSHLDFRIAELQGICKALQLESNLPSLIDAKSPIFIVDLPDPEILNAILSRSVLLKNVYEFFCKADDFDELHKQIRNNLGKLEPYNVPEQSWAVKLRPVGKKRGVDIFTESRRVAEYLPLAAAPVKMTNPVNKFLLLSYYESEFNDAPSTIYFLREFGSGRTQLKVKLNLKERAYIGNTTMDPELALLQANIVAVPPKGLVLDPFCGTGGLILPAAEFGGFVWGTEINYQIAHGQGKSSRHDQKELTDKECVRASFEQYGTESRLMSVIVADTSRHGLWARGSIFDAIVADPPYGVREKGRKLGPKERKEHWVLPGSASHVQHFPEKQVYQLDAVFCDLADLAARLLVIGGRVSFWFPVILQTYSDAVLPAHPALRLVSNCEQPLTLRTSRRLLTYEKTREPNDGEKATSAFYQYADTTFRDAVLKARNKEVVAE